MDIRKKYIYYDLFRIVLIKGTQKCQTWVLLFEKSMLVQFFIIFTNLKNSIQNRNSLSKGASCISLRLFGNKILGDDFFLSLFWRLVVHKLYVLIKFKGKRLHKSAICMCVVFKMFYTIYTHILHVFYSKNAIKKPLPFINLLLFHSFHTKSRIIIMFSITFKERCFFLKFRTFHFALPKMI